MANKPACPLISGVVAIPPAKSDGYTSMGTTRSVIVPCLGEGCMWWCTTIPEFVDKKYVKNAEKMGFCKLIGKCDG